MRLLLVIGAAAALVLGVQAFLWWVPEAPPPASNSQLGASEPDSPLQWPEFFTQINGADRAVERGNPDSQDERNAIAEALSREHGMRDLIPSQIHVHITGKRYQLVEYADGLDVAYAVYDRVNRTITSTAPTGEHLFIMPSQESVVLVEGTRMMVYKKDDELLQELADSHIDGSAGETYLGSTSPQIVALDDHSISVQVYKDLKEDGGVLDPPLPIRMVTLQMR